VQYKWEKKFTNKIGVSNCIQGEKEAANTQCESLGVTTIMMHSSTHPTTLLCIENWCTLSTFRKLLIVDDANPGEATGYGQMSKLGYINGKLVYGSKCGEFPAESTGMWQRYIIHHS